MGKLQATQSRKVTTPVLPPTFVRLAAVLADIAQKEAIRTTSTQLPSVNRK